MTKTKLTNYAWLSIGAAVATIGLKAGAYWLTGSVGLLSDAIESLVNLVAAVFALWILTVAFRPPDDDHPYGHTKAEYFSGGIEGTLIFIAAVSIMVTAVQRLLHPQPLEKIGLGLLISTGASLINLIVARVLIVTGKRYRSITLEADGAHLMTDVWTSVGVIVAVGLVKVTKWQMLDPIIAIGVAINILWSGARLVHRAVLGLMDVALPKEDIDQITAILSEFEKREIKFHALHTRQAGVRRFVSVHILVPGNWSVQKGHQILEEIEAALRRAFEDIHILTHLEPLEDPVSWDHGQEKPPAAPTNI